MTRDSAWQAPVHVDTHADPKSASNDKSGKSAGMPMLAAVRVADDADVETLMEEIMEALRESGCRLAGFVQRSIDHHDGRGPYLVLVNVRDNQETPLSAPRGYPLSDTSRPCTVDDSVLADFAGRVTRDLDSDVDLLILNRFGRREKEGRGCRDEMAAALARDTPVLCVVRESHVDAWQTFGGDMVCCVEPDLAAVRSWYLDCRRAA